MALGYQGSMLDALSNEGRESSATPSAARAHEWGLDRRAALVDGRRRRALRPAGGGPSHGGASGVPCTTALSTSRVSSASIPRASSCPTRSSTTHGRPWIATTAPSSASGSATAGLCLYRDGRDSVAWHGDTIGRASTEDTMVAIVSLGAPRALLLRPRVAAMPSATSSATATCWSWAGPASERGSTQCPSRLGSPGRA